MKLQKESFLTSMSIEIQRKYYYNVINSFNSIINKYMFAIKKLETEKNKYASMPNISSIGFLSNSEFNTLVKSLFSCNTTANYMKALVKLKENFVKFKTAAGDYDDNSLKLNYALLENYSKEQISNIINNFDLGMKFDYFSELQKDNDNNNVEAEKKSEDEPFITINNIRYINYNKMEVLLSDLINKFDKFKSILITYNLSDIQQVDFSLEEYNAIGSNIKKMKNSKTKMVDIIELIELLKTSDTNDYEDPFSENYFTIIAVFLELLCFTFHYFQICLVKSDVKPFKYKDQTYLIDFINENIVFYFDKLICSTYEIDLFQLYIDINKINNRLNVDEIRENMKAKLNEC